MNKSDPQFMWIALIIPTLFAMTLIADGIQKFIKQEPAWVSFGLGILFICLVFVAYFFILR